MNRLWKASCGDKELLIKEFSRKRFEKKQLKEIDQALKRQLAVKKLGIPCPYLYTWKGHVIRFLADGTAYMVMDFCCGKKEDSKTVILSQLESLGEICALMHKEFSTLSVKGVNGFPIERGKLLSSLRENDTAHKQMLCAHDPFEYQKTLLAQGPILEHLTDQFFLRFPKGFGHEDFTPDNLLFHEHIRYRKDTGLTLWIFPTPALYPVQRNKRPSCNLAYGKSLMDTAGVF